jgi:hypothetical protein
LECKLKNVISNPPLQRKECNLWENLKAVEWDLATVMIAMNGVNTIPKMRKPKLTPRNRIIWSSASRLFENIKRNFWKRAVLLTVPPCDMVFRFLRKVGAYLPVYSASRPRFLVMRASDRQIARIQVPKGAESKVNSVKAAYSRK